MYDTVHLDEAALYEGEERPTVSMRGIRSTVNTAFTVPQMLWPQVKDQTRRRRSPGELVQQFCGPRLEMRHRLLDRHCQRPLCQPLRISKHSLLVGKFRLIKQDIGYLTVLIRFFGQ